MSGILKLGYINLTQNLGIAQSNTPLSKKQQKAIQTAAELLKHDIIDANKLESTLFPVCPDKKIFLSHYHGLDLEKRSCANCFIDSLEWGNINTIIQYLLDQNCCLENNDYGGSTYSLDRAKRGNINTIIQYLRDPNYWLENNDYGGSTYSLDPAKRIITSVNIVLLLALTKQIEQSTHFLFLNDKQPIKTGSSPNPDLYTESPWVVHEILQAENRWKIQCLENPKLADTMFPKEKQRIEKHLQHKVPLNKHWKEVQDNPKSIQAFLCS
jgi:hypothetical protein